MSPLTDFYFENRQNKNNHSDWLPWEQLLALRSVYLNGQEPSHYLASPSYASLNDLPPIMLQVGKNEIPSYDSIDFYQKALQANIEIELDIHENFFSLLPTICI